MIISPRFSNWLFMSEGEVYIYWSDRLRVLYCKYFSHAKLNFDEWHCDRCFACLEHDKETCEY